MAFLPERPTFAAGAQNVTQGVLSMCLTVFLLGMVWRGSVLAWRLTVGLAMVAALVPQRLMGFILGMWFLTQAMASLLGGYVATFTAMPEGMTDPLQTLPIYTSLEKLDWRLVEAAFDLGANRFQALKRIIIPLSMPGIIAGVMLVFIPSLGNYIIPELLGGGKSLMIGNLIQLQFGSSHNWPFGAALAFALLSLVLLAMLSYSLRFKANAASVQV